MSASGSSDPGGRQSATLRIVHCFRAPVGGVFRHVRDLVEAQAAAGHQVGVVCDSTTGGAHEERLFAELAPRLALGLWRTPMQRHIGPGDLVSGWRTLRLIRALRPDIVHGHGAKGGVYARVFGTLLGLSGLYPGRLYSPHGGSLHYDRKTAKGRLFFFLERMMERWTDCLLFVSDYELQTFRRKIGVPSAPWRIIHNGLRPAEFEPVPASADAADLLYIGAMRDLKGPDLFLDAMAQAEMKLGRQITALMVGDGEGLPAYREQAERLGLAERVRFERPMPARQAFGMARLVVVPSRAEALPYIVLEALAAGKPAMASAVGGIPEIFGQGSPALVEPNAADIAAKMAEALSDLPAYRAVMPDIEGLRARFGVDVMAERVESAYLDTLRRRGASAPEAAGPFQT